MIQALGGLCCALHQFAVGLPQSQPYTQADTPPLRHMLENYQRLAESERTACHAHPQGRVAIKAIQNLPYPDSIAPFIDIMLNARVRPQDCFQLEIKPKALFRCRNDNKCREVREGFRQVTPINTSLNVLAQLTGRNKQQFPTHLECTVPNTDVSTRDVLSNTANAIVACFANTGESVQIAKAIYEKACCNCALGGTGLYRSISNPSGTGKARKTASAQAFKVFFALAAELHNCTTQLFNIIIITPGGLCGQRSASKSRIADFD